MATHVRAKDLQCRWLAVFQLPLKALGIKPGPWHVAVSFVLVLQASHHSRWAGASETVESRRAPHRAESHTIHVPLKSLVLAPL